MESGAGDIFHTNRSSPTPTLTRAQIKRAQLTAVKMMAETLFQLQKGLCIIFLKPTRKLVFQRQEQT